MVLLTAHEIIPLNDKCIYISEGLLVVESDTTARYVKNVPENAVQQIAVGLAEGKNYIEFEDSELVMEDENDNDA